MAIYTQADIRKELLGIAYNTFRMHINTCERLKGMIQPRKRKTYYTQKEKDLIVETYLEKIETLNTEI